MRHVTVAVAAVHEGAHLVAVHAVVRGRVALLRVLAAARVVIRATTWIVTTWIVRVIRTVLSETLLISVRPAERVGLQEDAAEVQAVVDEALQSTALDARTARLRLPVEVREAVVVRVAPRVDGTPHGLAIRRDMLVQAA